MKMSDAQVQAVLALSGPERYSHFIKVAAAQRSVWGLFSDGWALAETDDGQPVFPVWPAKPYAERAAIESWAGYTPTMIDMDDLFGSLIPKLREAETLIGVFPTPSEKAVTPALDQFVSDLQDELDRIE